MSGWIILGDVACAIGGGAIAWHFKEKIQAIWTDANTIAARLHAKAEAIAQAARKV